MQMPQQQAPEPQQHAKLEKQADEPGQLQEPGSEMKPEPAAVFKLTKSAKRRASKRCQAAKRGFIYARECMTEGLVG